MTLGPRLSQTRSFAPRPTAGQRPRDPRELPAVADSRVPGSRLRQLELVVTAAWQRPFYRRHWEGAHWQEVMELFRQGRSNELPPIRKRDLRDHPEEIFDYDGAIDVVSSSGTTGRPVDVPVHADEDAYRVLLIRRTLTELGVGPGSRVLQLLSLNDLFSLGPIAWNAARGQGACVLRCSPQRIGRVLQVIDRMQPEFVIGNPFALARMAAEAGDAWLDPDRLPDRALLGAAATFDANLAPTPAAETAIRRWGLQEALNPYGCGETGPIAYECRAHQGLHLHDDYHHVELIEPGTGRPVTDPECPGEVVVTALTLPRGFLPVRYATGDVVAWLRTDRCSCGRTSPRLGPVIGRVDQHLKITGQTVFPDLLLDIADRCSAVHRSAVCVRLDELSGDDVTLLLVPERGGDPDRVLREVTQRITHHLAVSPKVEITDEDGLNGWEKVASLNTNQVKIPRFFDLRGAR